MTEYKIPDREWLLVEGQNVILNRLRSRLPVLSLGIRGSRTTEIVRHARSSGHHVIWIDMEHSTIPPDTAAQISVACLDAGIVPLFRPPEKTHGLIGQMLDGGALGILAGGVETPEEAAHIAAACRFAPIGNRSQVQGLPLFGMRKLPVKQHNELANRSTLVTILLESEVGIGHIDAIAALPGVDMVAVGTNDLMATMGIDGNYKHEEIRQVYMKGIEACKRHGKHFLMGGVGDYAYLREFYQAGAAPMIFTGMDSDLMRDSLRDRVASSVEAAGV